MRCYVQPVTPVASTYPRPASPVHSSMQKVSPVVGNVITFYCPSSPDKLYFVNYLGALGQSNLVDEPLPMSIDRTF